MFYDANNFNFIPTLEKYSDAIMNEYLALEQCNLIQWPQKEIYNSGWKAFGLFDYPEGKEITENCEKCPITSRIIKSFIPTHGAVGFSVLEPSATIYPHVGNPDNFLRCHLALIIPEGDCSLTVGREERKWTQGKAFVFSDKSIHSAKNLTNEKRVILLIDFAPP